MGFGEKAQEGETQDSSLSVVSEVSVINVSVDGMTCQSCAMGITAELMNCEGINNVNVDLESKIVSIEVNPQSDVTRTLISEKISEAGYTVIGFDE